MTDDLHSVLHSNLLGATRDRFAGEFSAQVAAAIPEIREFLVSEAAGSKSADQRRVLEHAANSLWDRRAELQRELARTVAGRCDAICNPLLHRLGRPQKLSLDSLSLVGDDQLEDEIAARDCGRRLKEQCEYEIWGLTARVLTLLDMEHLRDDENPVMPAVLAQSLMDALATIESHSAIRMAIFKALGPRLFDIVPSVYRATNDFLTGNGIDVEMDFQGRVVRRPDRAAAHADAGIAPARPASMAAGAHAPVHDSAASRLANADPGLVALLTRLMELTVTQNAPAAGDGAADFVNPGDREIRRPDTSDQAVKKPLVGFDDTRTTRPPATHDAEPPWLTCLHDVQRERIVDGRVPGRQTLHEVAGALRDLLDARQRLVTDLVTGIFDRLRENHRLHPRLLAAVDRLQLPVLETALHDDSLITDKDNVAWRLIDVIAEFAMTVGDDGDDSAVRTVENMVDGLARLQPATPEAFEGAWRSLNDLLFHHQEAALLRDAGVSALEADESRARAGRHVDHQLAMRLSGWTLPAPILRFLASVVRSELVNCHLKHGPSSLEWKVELALVDELLASMHIATAADKRERLAEKLDAVFARPVAGWGEDQRAAIELFRVALRETQERVAAGVREHPDAVRFEPAPGSLEMEAEAVGTAGVWTQLDTAPGDWLESSEPLHRGRWRLNWVTTAGTAVLKHFETRGTWIVPMAEFRSLIESSVLRKVQGLGLVSQAVEGALRHMTQRLESRRPVH